MKLGSTFFLKLVILLIGIIVLTLLLWFPQTEGRAVNLDLISIYKDPFIIYIYIVFIPFFVALYQSFKLLGYIEQDEVFSQISVNALRNIKYCIVAFIGFIAIALVWIKIMSGDDDPAGAIAIGLVMIFASSVIATGTAVAQRLLQSAVDIKSENDLTV